MDSCRHFGQKPAIPSHWPRFHTLGFSCSPCQMIWTLVNHIIAEAFPPISPKDWPTLFCFSWHQPGFHVFPKTKTFIFAGQCPASTLDGCPKMRSKGEMCRRFFLVVQPRRRASSHPSVNPGRYKCPRTTSHPLLMLSPHLDTASAEKNIMWQNCTNLAKRSLWWILLDLPLPVYTFTLSAKKKITCEKEHYVATRLRSVNPGW